VVSGNGDAFRLDRMGNHALDLYDVDASGATYECGGQAEADCKAGLTAGAQVQVRGTLLGCFESSVAVAAAEVNVKKP
jgi:hypothetical protein